MDDARYHSEGGCNLHGLCRHHHRLKDADGWQVLARPDGRLTWISPAGRRHTSEPFDYRVFTDPTLDRPAPDTGASSLRSSDPGESAESVVVPEAEPPPF